LCFTPFRWHNLPLEKHLKSQTAQFKLSLDWKDLRSVRECLLVMAAPAHWRIATKLACARALQDAERFII
jgi:hypothetical protein